MKRNARVIRRKKAQSGSVGGPSSQLCHAHELKELTEKIAMLEARVLALENSAASPSGVYSRLRILREGEGEEKGDRRWYPKKADVRFQRRPSVIGLSDVYRPEIGCGTCWTCTEDWGGRTLGAVRPPSGLLTKRELSLDRYQGRSLPRRCCQLQCLLRMRSVA
jgi:hypothetical protein